jgi:hypothetical protein
MESEIERIISLLKQTFEKGAWHGPSVKEGLQGITEEQALQKLPHTHSILELVGHMTAWRHFHGIIHHDLYILRRSFSSGRQRHLNRFSSGFNAV